MKEASIEVSEQDRNRELLSNIQFQNKPDQAIIDLVKKLPYPLEETAARLAVLQLNQCSLPSSLHMAMPGYLSYQLTMDVEFNSLRYIWNFLKEELPDMLLDEIRGMHKFHNEKGVVFNIP